jgi:hypothetical protein
MKSVSFDKNLAWPYMRALGTTTLGSMYLSVKGGMDTGRRKKIAYVVNIIKCIQE